jgi:hypothetical protein
MLPTRLNIPQEVHCPVPEDVLGQLYRSSPHGLDELVALIPAETRAMLALYCYRRAHLQSIGLAIATSCEERDLEAFGENAGRALFEKAHKAPDKVPNSHYLLRRKVTLSVGVLREFIQDEVDLKASLPIT